ncbi:TetR/AcrR family transcriptional regulator [Clostridium sp. LBM24168]
MRSTEKRLTSRDLQAIKRKKQLLDSAKKLFAKNGYYNTPVRSITQSIGMADGLIYHYFSGGKIEILHTIFEEGYEILNKRVEETLNGINDEMTLNEIMVYFCKNLRETFKLDSDLIVIMFHEKDLLGKEINELLLHTFARIWSSINNLLKQRTENGEIEKLDFDMATHQFMATVFSTVAMNHLAASMSQDSSDSCIKNLLTANMLQDNNDNYSYIRRLMDFTISLWKKPN